MQTLIREKGSSQWVAPARDIIRMYPAVVTALVENYSKKAFRAAAELPQVAEVTDAEFSEALSRWRGFVESAIMEPQPNTYEAAKAAGLLELKPAVRVALLAQIGMLFTQVYQDSARDFKEFMDPTVFGRLSEQYRADAAAKLFLRHKSRWFRFKNMLSGIFNAIKGF